MSVSLSENESSSRKFIDHHICFSVVLIYFRSASTVDETCDPCEGAKSHTPFTPLAKFI